MGRKKKDRQTDEWRALKADSWAARQMDGDVDRGGVAVRKQHLTCSVFPSDVVLSCLKNKIKCPRPPVSDRPNSDRWF